MNKQEGIGSDLIVEWTDVMAFKLPEGLTEEKIVDLVIESGLDYCPDDITEDKLVRLGLSEDEAALARDRVYGGIFRAMTKINSNRPDRYKDPLAWISYNRTIKDYSIAERIYPQYLSIYKNKLNKFINLTVIIIVSCLVLFLIIKWSLEF